MESSYVSGITKTDMKTIIYSIGMALTFVAPSFSQAQPVVGPSISFEKEVHNYGEVAKDGDGKSEFVFTNTGTEPLILANVKGSCSCTVPSWPKEPIPPGGEGVIKVKYNTALVGAINKTVTITSNAVNTPTKVIRITGTVVNMPVKSTRLTKG